MLRAMRDARPPFPSRVAAIASVAAVALLPFGPTIAMAWKVGLCGGMASPVVSNGTVFVGTRDGLVLAFAAASGSPLWSFQTGEGLPSGGQTIFVGASGSEREQLQSAMALKRSGRAEIVSTPVAAGELVFAASEDHTLYALDAHSGSTKWYTDLMGDQAWLYLADSLLLASAGTDLVHAVDPRSGKVRWRIKAPLLSCTASGEGRLYATSWGDTSNVHALDPTDGRELWNLPVQGEPLPPLYWDGGLYVACTCELFEEPSHTALLALDPSSGAIRWKFETGGRKKAGSGLRVPPVEIAGDAVIFTTDQGVHVLDARTGNVRWSHALEQTQDRVVVDGSTLIVTAGSIHAFDLRNGDSRWEHAIVESGAKTWATLGSSGLHVLDHGILYVVTKKMGHAIQAIDVATGKNRWTCRVGHEVLARPALAGGLLFVSTAPEWTVGTPPRPATLLAIDASTGRY